MQKFNKKYEKYTIPWKWIKPNSDKRAKKANCWIPRLHPKPACTFHLICSHYVTFLGRHHDLFSLGRRCSRNTGNSSSSRSEISICWHLFGAAACTVAWQWPATCPHIKYEADKTQHVWFSPFSLLPVLYVIISLSDSKLLLNVAGLPFLQKWSWQRALRLGKHS